MWNSPPVPVDITVLEDQFRALKVKEGVTESKLRAAPDVAELLDVSSVSDMAAVLKNLVEVTKDENLLALLNALNLTEPRRPKLTERRKRLDVPASTLKYREKRAVKVLLDRIEMTNEPLATSQFITHGHPPVSMTWHLHGHETYLRISAAEGHLLVGVHTSGPPLDDWLLLQATSDAEGVWQLQASYMAGEAPQQIASVSCPYNNEPVAVLRECSGGQESPSLVSVMWTARDAGVSTARGRGPVHNGIMSTIVGPMIDQESVHLRWVSEG